MAKHRNCTKCNNPIVLNPSAEERSKESGKPASYYLDLFTVCSPCQIKSWYEGIKK